MPISVVIPSYRSPKYLDYCLRSCFENQVHENEIIVIFDGFAEESEHIISKYKGVNVVPFPENRGQQIAHNTGVTLASNEAILIINDDNVLPRSWDTKLMEIYDEKIVCAPNQIEPVPSIFKSFHIKDFGRTPDDFQYMQYLNYEQEISRPFLLDPTIRLRSDGQTWPVFMAKKWYMILCGVDLGFPSPAVADHDFFLRCELAGLKMCRDMGTHIWHFAGAATKATPERAAAHAEKEQDAHQYFNWKWGIWSQMNLPIDNSKLPRGGESLRGIKV